MYNNNDKGRICENIVYNYLSTQSIYSELERITDLEEQKRMGDIKATRTDTDIKELIEIKKGHSFNNKDKLALDCMYYQKDFKGIYIPSNARDNLGWLHKIHCHTLYAVKTNINYNNQTAHIEKLYKIRGWRNVANELRLKTTFYRETLEHITEWGKRTKINGLDYLEPYYNDNDKNKITLTANLELTKEAIKELGGILEVIEINKLERLEDIMENKHKKNTLESLATESVRNEQ